MFIPREKRKQNNLFLIKYEQRGNFMFCIKIGPNDPNQLLAALNLLSHIFVNTVTSFRVEPCCYVLHHNVCPAVTNAGPRDVCISISVVLYATFLSTEPRVNDRQKEAAQRALTHVAA